MLVQRLLRCIEHSAETLQKGKRLKRFENYYFLRDREK